MAMWKPMEIFSQTFETMWNLVTRSLEPLVEVRELEKIVRVTVDLPMVNKKDIEIRLSGDVLEIDAELNRCVTFHRWGTVQKQCEFRSFYKRVLLSVKVTATGAKATFKRGVLVVDLPKAEETHSVKIE